MRQAVKSILDIVIVVALCFALGGSSQGADGTWTLNNAGSWGNASDPPWAGGIVADGVGSTADFSTVDLTGNRNVTVDGNATWNPAVGVGPTVGILDIGFAGDTNSYTFNQVNSGKLTFDNGASAAQINNLNISNQQNARPIIQLPVLLNSDLEISNSGTSSNLANPLHVGTNIIWFNGQNIQAGTPGLKTISNVGTGSALVWLSGNNQITDGAGQVSLVQDSSTSLLYFKAHSSTYTGGTFVKQGTLFLEQANPGSSTGAITLGDSSRTGQATLLLRNPTITSNVVLASGALGTLTLATDTSNVYNNTYNGTIELNGNDLNIAPNGVTTFNNAINATGGGTITNMGSGTTVINGDIAGSLTGITQNSTTSTLALSGTNSYTGLHTVNAGALVFRKQASISGGVNAITPATVTVESGATLGLGVGASPTFFNAADVATVLNALGGSPSTGLKSGAFIGLDTTAGNFNQSTALNDPVGSVLGLSKLGANTLTLSAANSYSGGTNILQGALAITADNQLGAPGTSVNFSGGGLLDTGTSTLTLSRPMVTGFGGGGFTNAAGGDLTIDSAITGSGTLLKNGAGTVTLTGNSTLTSATGNVQVNGGSLVIGDGGQLTSAGTNNVTGISGNTSNASILVTGIGSNWTSSVRTTVGGTGHNNTLTVNDGATASFGEQLWIGGASGPQNNAFYVDGDGSQVNLVSTIQLQAGTGSIVKVTDGGKVIVNGGNLVVNDNGAARITIDGAGSLLQLNNNVQLTSKSNGGASWITVENGGTLTSAGNSFAGATNSIGNNIITVTGEGSSWTNNGNIAVNSNGTGNDLLVTEGGQVIATSFSLGNAANSSGNTALVESGGLLQAGTSLTFGHNTNSNNNTLTANTGGILQFTSATPTIVQSFFGANNAIFIDGGTLSYKGAVDDVDMNANTGVDGVGLFTWSGTNTLRLDDSSSSTNYTLTDTGPATTYATLELINGGSATGQIVVGDGGLLTGNGTAGDVSVSSGGTVSPGLSPGPFGAASADWNNGGSLLFEINDATGDSGSDPGWDLWTITGDLDLSGLTAGGFQIDITSLMLDNTAGDAANFDNSADYAWKFAEFGSLTGTFEAGDFTLIDNFSNDQNGGAFGIQQNGNTLEITFSAFATAVVPEPASIALGSFFALAWAVLAWRRRRNAHSAA